MLNKLSLTLLFLTLTLSISYAKAPTTTQLSKVRSQGNVERDVVEVKLSNGMLFLLVKRPNVPVFSANIRVKAGGVDETTGYTGLAHILEHMAFKGTTIVGTRHWAKEKKCLHRVQRAGEALSLARQQSKGKRTPLVKALEKHLQAMQQQHKRWGRPDEFSRIYQRYGGKGLNATTGKDLTTYYISLPAQRLELWARQEASRLAAPVFRNYYKERSVVAEERRQAMSRANGRLYEAFLATAFVAHPYRLPTVGWMSDITTIPYRALRQFFRKYYVPSNMVGTIVGDIDIVKTRALLEQTFGRIPAGPPPPPVRTVEPEQQGERRITVEFRSRPQVMIGYHKPTSPHFHDDVFYVMEALLTSGPSSRLYRALVQTKMAQDIHASSIPGSRFPNLFALSVTPMGSYTTKQIEARIYREIRRLQTTPVPKVELQKVRAKLKMSFLRGLRSNHGLAMQLGYFQSVVGDWRHMSAHLKRLDRITPQIIMQVARKYLHASNRTVATLKTADPLASLDIDDDLDADLDLSKSTNAPKPTATTKPTKKPTINPIQKPTTKPTKMLAKEANKKPSVSEQVKLMLSEIKIVPMTIRGLPQELQKHPNQLTFPKAPFTPPLPKTHQLANGIKLYFLENNALPLVNIYVLLRAGRVYDPHTKVGLAEMAGEVIRTGGFGSLTEEQINHQLALRGARLTTQIHAEYGYVSLSLHSNDLSWGLPLLVQMLRQPKFSKKSIALKRAQMVEGYRRWKDDPFLLSFGHFRKLVYGPKNRWSLRPTPQTIKAITRNDLLQFHKTYVRPQHIRIAVSGNFKSARMLQQLKTLLGSWKAPNIKFPTIARIPTRTQPRVAMLRKKIAQSVVLVGHLGPRRHHPQWLAGSVMNHILGSGFFSRLLTELRSKRGIAYAAGSKLFAGPDRGIFVAYTGTQASTTTRALQVMLQVLRNLHKKPEISHNVLTRTKQALANRFIFLFESTDQIVYRQAYFDYFGYPKDHLATYRERLKRLTPSDIHRAIRTFLHPDQFVIVVAGWDPKFGKPLLSNFGKVLKLSSP